MVVPEYTSQALIVVEQPSGYEYVNARGVDNRTGQEIITVIHLNEEQERVKPTFTRSIKSVKEEPHESSDEVIYLFGDIYQPTKFEVLLSKVFSAKVVAVASLLLLFLLPIYMFCTKGKLCYVTETDNEEVSSKVVWTSLASPRDIAETFVLLKEEDKVEVEEFGTTGFLTVIRSYPVYISVDGSIISTNVLDSTLEEALTKIGVELGEEDIVSHDLSHMLSEDDSITIKRVTYKDREAETRQIPFSRVARQSPLMSKETEIIIIEGVDGIAEDYYLDRYIDDVFDSETLIRTVVVEEPVEEYYLTGDPKAAASFVDKNKYTDIEIVDSKPTEYIDVIEDAICTAYSFGPNTYGASGMKMMQGFVATNPEIIPYGTLMYIASDRFTYGWAVAADCGTAMMQGYVDIDCYFETYIESVMFGKKLMDVYIVKQLTWHELEEYVANRMFYSRVPDKVEEPLE